ncbi:MAG: tetratricopeptide repeat protein [Labilithrix sp.]|nr:tetratricopeptide repeat protein [Labilithrix sp.]MCW5815183.1 tetratricopeptide repeat protein [Labilithrix sp.]
MAKLRAPLLFCLVVLALPATATAAAEPATAAPSAAAAADVDLGKHLAALTGDDATARKAAAKTIEDLGADAVPAIAKELAAQRKVAPPAVATAMKGIKEDLAETLLATKSDQPGWQPAVTTVVLMRSLAKTATTPAASEIIKVGGDHGGVFKPEVARHLKSLGDKAVPALILSRKEPSSELRHWAAGQLEGMGKRVPGDAVQTKDNQVLAETLRAFATVHDMDALPVLLSFVNSDRIQVRAAAREAIGQFGQDAVWKLREAYSNVTGKPASEGMTAAQVAKELFAAYDRLRLQEVYGLLEEGLAKEKAGDLDGAIAAFDKVLARQPLLDRRGEMVGAYIAYAQKLEESDSAKALALYRKALRLNPETARAPQVEAEIAYLEGKELQGRGVADPEPFKRALSLDPTHAKARAELNRLDTNADERDARFRAFAAAAAVILVALTGILLFGGRKKPRRPASAAS